MNTQILNVDELGAGHLDCAETIKTLIAQRDELLDAMKSILFIARGAIDENNHF